MNVCCHCRELHLLLSALVAIGSLKVLYKCSPFTNLTFTWLVITFFISHKSTPAELCHQVVQIPCSDREQVHLKTTAIYHDLSSAAQSRQNEHLHLSHSSSAFSFRSCCQWWPDLCISLCSISELRSSSSSRLWSNTDTDHIQIRSKRYAFRLFITGSNLIKL